MDAKLTDETQITMKVHVPSDLMAGHHRDKVQLKFSLLAHRIALYLSDLTDLPGSEWPKATVNEVITALTLIDQAQQAYLHRDFNESLVLSEHADKLANRFLSVPLPPPPLD